MYGRREWAAPDSMKHGELMAHAGLYQFFFPPAFLTFSNKGRFRVLNVQIMRYQRFKVPVDRFWQDQGLRVDKRAIRAALGKRQQL
jgi:hypothetical protein